MSHDHDHSHSHSDHHHHHHHDHGDAPMSLEDKLATLFAHWVDHNESHKDNFLSWADKAAEGNLEAVAAHLKEAGELSCKVTDALKKAKQALEG